MCDEQVLRSGFKTLIPKTRKLYLLSFMISSHSVLLFILFFFNFFCVYWHMTLGFGWNESLLNSYFSLGNSCRLLHHFAHQKFHRKGKGNHKNVCNKQNDENGAFYCRFSFFLSNSIFSFFTHSLMPFITKRKLKKLRTVLYKLVNLVEVLYGVESYLIVSVI